LICLPFIFLLILITVLHTFSSYTRRVQSLLSPASS